MFQKIKEGFVALGWIMLALFMLVLAGLSILAELGFRWVI